MTRSINDPVEQVVADALSLNGIEFTHESENKAQGLDFYIPSLGLLIECKRFHTDRIDDQVKNLTNVIVVQGMDAAHAFYQLLNAAVSNA